MITYETSATVEAQGRILLADVPFAPGTQVDVIIHPAENGIGRSDSREDDRIERLLAALDMARNVEPLSSFDRGELYDRDVLH